MFYNTNKVKMVCTQLLPSREHLKQGSPSPSHVKKPCTGGEPRGPALLGAHSPAYHTAQVSVFVGLSETVLSSPWGPSESHFSQEPSIHLACPKVAMRVGGHRSPWRGWTFSEGWK